jgi:hypothetical protein
VWREDDGARIGSIAKLERGGLRGHHDVEAPLIRGVARLQGEVPPQDYEALANAIAKRAGFSADPFVRVIRHVRRAEKLPREDAVAILQGYLAGMERLVAYIDGLAR